MPKTSSGFFLDRKSIQFAVDSILQIGDGDVFPRLFEFQVIHLLGEYAIDELCRKDLSNYYNIRSHRSAMIPKDTYSIRKVTQLDPIDSIIFTAIIHQFGQEFEKLRRPVSENTVFSNRFKPSSGGHLYDTSINWTAFWKHSINMAHKYEYALFVDISDFYNQINHHTLENELDRVSLPNQVKKWIRELCQATTVKISSGIPVGPHASHLIAELTLCSTDDALIDYGFPFCRYVDDYIFFANSQTEMQKIAYRFGYMIDKHQKLVMNRQKTKLMNKSQFIEHCKKMIDDRPINSIDATLTRIIKKHSSSDPYKPVSLSDLNNDELAVFTKDNIEKILNQYLLEEDPNYIRIRWFIRRLTQIGHPAAVDFLVGNLNRLLPAISEICRYINSIKSEDHADWKEIGKNIIEYLENPIISSLEYMKMTIVSLFAQNKRYNNSPLLMELYDKVSSEVKRKIILFALNHDSKGFVKAQKENFSNQSPWERRAFLYAVSILSRDEKKFFLSTVKTDDIMESFIMKWVKNN